MTPDMIQQSVSNFSRAGGSHECRLRADYDALAESVHGLLGRVLMLESRIDWYEKQLSANSVAACEVTA
jgi:hypothetical protein